MPIGIWTPENDRIVHYGMCGASGDRGAKDHRSLLFAAYAGQADKPAPNGLIRVLDRCTQLRVLALRARTSRYRGLPSSRRPRAVKGAVVTVNPDAVRSSRTAFGGQVR